MESKIRNLENDTPKSAPEHNFGNGDERKNLSEPNRRSSVEVEHISRKPPPSRRKISASKSLKDLKALKDLSTRSLPSTPVKKMSVDPLAPRSHQMIDLVKITINYMTITYFIHYFNRLDRLWRNIGTNSWFRGVKWHTPRWQQDFIWRISTKRKRYGRTYWTNIGTHKRKHRSQGNLKILITLCIFNFFMNFRRMQRKKIPCKKKRTIASSRKKRKLWEKKSSSSKKNKPRTKPK